MRAQEFVLEELDPFRLERLDPQTRRVLQRMADHADPGSWLSAEEAYAMQLGLKSKTRDPRTWEQEIQRFVDLWQQVTKTQKIINEVKACGDCFEVAGRAMITPEVPEMRLVHAYVTGQGPVAGKRFSHAWNEIGDVVLDYSNGRKVVMRKPQYYALGQVSTQPGEYAVYNDVEAKKKMVQTKHWGPWDLDPAKENIKEVQILSRVKGKGADLSNLPRSGGKIPANQELQHLGRKQADFGDYEIWRDYLGGQVSYHLFDPQSRQVIITVFGSRYQRNPLSFIVSGLYAAPNNPIKAHDFYRALITQLGLTLISDRKQSPGGQAVWQRLETLPDVEVYGFDTKTGEVLNFGASDAEMYAVPPGAAKDKESKYTARNIRLVATKK